MCSIGNNKNLDLSSITEREELKSQRNTLMEKNSSGYTTNQIRSSRGKTFAGASRLIKKPLATPNVVKPTPSQSVRQESAKGPINSIRDKRGSVSRVNSVTKNNFVKK